MAKRFVPNEEQKPVVSAAPDQAIFVQAGAGSGKTATLTARVVSALSGADNGGVPVLGGIDELLLVTFTENAATEIKERLRSQLNACGMYDEAAKVDEAYISTIHSLCRRILADNAVDLGMDPEFDLMTEESQKSRSQGDAVERAVSEIARTERFATLTAEYDLTSAGWDGQESASSIRGMLVSIVGNAMLSPRGVDAFVFPGSDPKSLSDAAHALVSQIKECLTLYESYEKDTKSRAAARDVLEDALVMAEAIDREAAGIDIGDLRAMTGLCRDIEGMSSLPNRSLLKLTGLRNADGEAARMVNARFTHLRAEAQLVRVRILWEELADLAKSTIDAADDIKDKNGTLDQDDLLRRAYDVLTEPDSEVAAKYKGRFKMVMVDEYQDTSMQQAEILKLLAVDEDGNAVPISHLATVGDAQQSIYRFRGADVEVMRQARREAMEDPSHMLATMSTNYRSHPDILEFVRAACDNGGNGGGLLPDFVPLTPDANRSDDFEGVSERVVFDCGLYDRFRDDYPNVSEARVASAERIANRFAWFQGECERRRLRKTMALLLGSMTHVDVYASALKRIGVPYVISGGSIFAKQPEVRTVEDLLRVIADPGDTVSLYRVLASDMFLLGDDDLLALHAGPGKSGQPLSRRLDEGILSGEWCEGIDEPEVTEHARGILLRAFDEAKALPMADVCENAIRRSGWLERLASEGAEGRMQAANILSALRHVRELVDDAGLGPVRGAKAFSEWLSMAKEPPATLAGHDDNPVQIMTVHASKGLQFSCVVVAELNRDASVAYKGLQLSPDVHQTRVTLAPSERDRDGRSRELRKFVWEDARNGVLKLFAEAEESLGDESRKGIAAQTLSWRRQSRLAEDAENGRKMYVALTRAEDFLMLSMLTGSKGKSACAAFSKKHRLGDQKYHPVYLRIADRIMEGLDAASAKYAADGRSGDPIYALPKPLVSGVTGEPIADDDGFVLHQTIELEPCSDRKFRFGEDAFGRYNISIDRGAADSRTQRPLQMPIYAESEVSETTVRFTPLTDMDAGVIPD